MKQPTPYIFTFCVSDDKSPSDNFVISFADADHNDMILQMREIYLSGFTEYGAEAYNQTMEEIKQGLEDIISNVRDAFDKNRQLRHVVWCKSNSFTTGKHDVGISCDLKHMLTLTHGIENHFKGMKNMKFKNNLTINQVARHITKLDVKESICHEMEPVIRPDLDPINALIPMFTSKKIINTKENR
jgi:hypothetical protein